MDNAGQLFGHIVAGDPMLGLAFIIPAYKIFDDIKSRFGEEPLLCPSPSVTQLYSAPNDGKVAEQPLLDLIKGNDTGTMILLHGLPRVNNTIIDKVIGPYARRAVYSISCGHLGWKTTNLKRIAEMMRKHCHIGAADCTRLKRATQYLQTVVQTVSDERMAFFQGDHSYSIMIDALDECMPATFSVTAISAKPPSFASIVPRMGAYSHIDGYHETNSDAAEGENHYFQNEILVWRYSP